MAAIEVNNPSGAYNGTSLEIKITGVDPNVRRILASDSVRPTLARYIAYDYGGNPFVAVVSDGVRGNCVFDGGFPKFYNNQWAATPSNNAFKFLRNAVNWTMKPQTGSTQRVLILGDVVASGSYSVGSTTANGFNTMFNGFLNSVGTEIGKTITRDFVLPSTAGGMVPEISYISAASYDLIIVMSSYNGSNSRLTTSTAQNILAANENGTGLIIITDHDTFQGTANHIMEGLGAYFYGNVDRSPVDVDFLIANYGNHPLWDGMTGAFQAGGSEGVVAVTQFPEWEYAQDSFLITTDGYHSINFLVEYMDGTFEQISFSYAFNIASPFTFGPYPVTTPKHTLRVFPTFSLTDLNNQKPRGLILFNNSVVGTFDMALETPVSWTQSYLPVIAEQQNRFDFRITFPFVMTESMNIQSVTPTYFRDAEGVRTSQVRTIKNSVNLYPFLDFEGDFAGNIKHNGTTIGTFSRTGNSGTVIDFISGNFTRTVNDGDTFQLETTSPEDISPAILNIERQTMTSESSSKVPIALREVMVFEASPREKLMSRNFQKALGAYGAKVSRKVVSKMFRATRNYSKNIRDVDSYGTVFERDDSFTCFPSLPRVISTNDILNNDFGYNGANVVAGSEALEIKSVKDVDGGSVTTTVFNGRISSISFTSSRPAGSVCSFIVEVQNRITLEIKESKVILYVTAAPPVTATDDIFNMIQWDSLTVTTAQLIANDTTSYPPVTFNGLVAGSAIGGTAILNGNNVVFTGTGFTGEPAGFRYSVKDAQNNTAIGNVSVNVLELPPIEAYLFTGNDLSVFLTEYTPPNSTTIFNSWARFGDNTNYFPGGTTPTGEAAAWTMSGENFMCTVNSTRVTGFISPKSYSNYTHTATLSSTAGDDDTIALVAAFRRDGANNRTLLVVREGGGNTGYTNSIGFSFMLNVNGTNNTVIKTPSVSTGYRSVGSWSTIGKTRLRVQRIGNTFIAQATPWTTGTPTNEQFHVNSIMELDLTQYPELSWALDEAPYGYACISQQNSLFSNIEFAGGLANEVMDPINNTVYTYSGSEWVAQPSNVTIQSVLGYPRTVTNPDTGKVYRIEANSVTEIT